MGDALWELDLSGKMKNRKIAEKIGGFNAFGVHRDGYIYLPSDIDNVIYKLSPK